jgi:ribosomal protein L4
VVKRYVDAQNAPDRQPKRRTHTPHNVSGNNRITNKKQQNTNGPP